VKNYIFFAIGCILGGFVVWFATRPGANDATPRDESGHDLAFQTALRELEDLRAENEKMRARSDVHMKRVAELQKELDAAHSEARATEPPPAAGEDESEREQPGARVPTEDDLRKAIEEFAPNLQAIILGRPAGKEAADKLRAVLAAGGDEAIRKIIGKFEDSSVPLQQRVLLAHVLGQSENPIAIEALENQLRDPDTGLMEKRFASHGLAFSDAEGIDAFLAQTARQAEDLGVRANSAFGLQRRGVAEGVDLYFAATDGAFAKKDPAALQYLGGIQLMGDKAKPYVRERLGTYKEEQALLVLISMTQAMNDKEAVPALEKLAYDASRPKSVQDSAKGAIKALTGSE
jgi:hypothetical protein